ncbi:nucleoporin p54 isoform X2 [Centruroides vittatus]|uniref:nucleoporin p54 isoform X2 n=1 Tax=Centruroides vittatus TaxID=120091 RepID=UPI00350FA82B
MARRYDGFSSTQTGFGFGTTQSGTSGFPTFGNIKTTGSTFPTFGTTNTSAPSFGSTPGFSFGTLGSSATPAPGFSFGATTSGNFSFGTGTSSFSFSGLGTTVTTTGFSFGGLGSTSVAPSSGFSFGGLGSSTTTPSLGSGFNFGTTVPNPSVNTITNIAMAISLPSVYGDERDVILAKWNQLQAFWGTGKGYFSNNSAPVEFTPENPFCRFKAIGYNCLPPWKVEDGLVGLIFNKKESDIRNQQQQMVDSLHRLFGSKPTISVHVEGIKSQPDEKTEVIIYLVERSLHGCMSRRIPSTDVMAFLEQPVSKTPLTSMDVVGLISKAAPTKEQLKQYLDNTVAGIDPLLWQQAKLDNPDPEKLIPVPMIGFSELKRRLKYQEHETKQHQERLDIIAEDISELKRRHSTLLAKISEHKRKQIELGHKVLKIMAQQEVMRKYGYAIQADEEQLRVQLEAIQAELNAPTQFKGRLKELLSQIRMQNHVGATFGESERYSLDENLQEEIKLYLKNQQEGLSHLLKILKDDSEDLKVIEEGLKESADRRR